MREEIIAFKERLSKLKSNVDKIEPEEFEEEVLELEEDITRAKDMYEGHGDYSCTSLLKEIKAIKKENDFYDEQAELNMMFPNRDDEDFDEDSMSYDSVFGDD